MASKVKEIHQYDGTQWGQAVPIGADASNVDVKTSDNTDIPLQSVLGLFNATEPSIKTQINGKVDKEGGDVAHAIINDPVNEIPIYDLDTGETSEKLISDDISTDTDMVVMSGDGENLTTMWGKFNRFRKRVDNKFKNYLVTSLEGVAPGASSDTKGYSTQALNNYFSDVIGYTSAADVSQTGSIASQLSSLNNNMSVLNSKLKCEFVSFVANYNTKLGTAKKWTYIKKSFTVSANESYILCVTQGYASGRPDGLGLSGSSNSDSPPISNSSTIGLCQRLTVYLYNTVATPYYIYTYRNTAPGSDNRYDVYGVRMK